MSRIGVESLNPASAAMTARPADSATAADSRMRLRHRVLAITTRWISFVPS